MGTTPLFGFVLRSYFFFFFFFFAKGSSNVDDTRTVPYHGKQRLQRSSPVAGGCDRRRALILGTRTQHGEHQASMQSTRRALVRQAAVCVRQQREDPSRQQARQVPVQLVARRKQRPGALAPHLSGKLPHV